MSEAFSCCLCGNKSYKAIFFPKSIVECKECGLRCVFNSKSETIQYTDLYYDTFKGSEDDLEKMWQQRWKVVKNYVKSGKLLDIGAGTGLFLSLTPAGFEGQGIEISDYAGKRADQRYGVKVLKSNLNDIQTKGYDIVTAWHVLEHFENPDQALAKVSELLKEDGLFFLALPNDNSFKQQLKRLLSYKSLYFDAPPSRENHLFFFTPQTLTKMLEKNSFKIIKLKADDYYGQRGIISNLKFLISNFLTETIPFNLATNILVVARRVK